VTRYRYMGVEGFEISVPQTHVRELFGALVSRDDARPAGLGACNSLRLEACFCLYGNGIDDTTTPIEAALTWLIGKGRREEGAFLVSNVILA
jgi:aminomethyltransferase